jgi:hypothetical protein
MARLLDNQETATRGPSIPVSFSALTPSSGFPNVATNQPTYLSKRWGDFFKQMRTICSGRTSRAADDAHRDVTSLVGAVTPYPLNSSAMLAVMPFAVTMSSFPPLRSPVRSLATPRPNSEDACRGLYRTAES